MEIGTSKESNLNSSISVLLPVHNAQATLAADVAKVLEFLPDVTPRFDVVIVDDGSTDATYEIAHELTMQYPQVRMLRNSQRRGQEAALIRGLEETSAEVVLGHVGTQRLDAKEIEKMLSTLGAALPSGGNRTRPVSPNQFAVGDENRKTMMFDSPRIDGPVAAPRSIAAAREAYAEQSVRPSRLFSWLERRGFSPLAQATLNSCIRVLRSQNGRALEMPPANLGADRRRDSANNAKTVDAGSATSNSTSPPRPNFLTRLKDFALGE